MYVRPTHPASETPEEIQATGLPAGQAGANIRIYFKLTKDMTGITPNVLKFRRIITIEAIRTIKFSPSGN